jgi:hypothetical protein
LGSSAKKEKKERKKERKKRKKKRKKKENKRNAVLNKCVHVLSTEIERQRLASICRT